MSLKIDLLRKCIMQFCLKIQFCLNPNCRHFWNHLSNWIKCVNVAAWAIAVYESFFKKKTSVKYNLYAVSCTYWVHNMIHFDICRHIYLHNTCETSNSINMTISAILKNYLVLLFKFSFSLLPTTSCPIQPLICFLSW